MHSPALPFDPTCTLELPIETVAPTETATRRHSLRLHLTVLGLRIGIFGLGLGSVAVGCVNHALPRLQGDGTTVLLLAAAVMTAVAAFCLTSDSLEAVRSRSDG